MSQTAGGPTGRRIETELRRGAGPIGTYREALVRFRHVFKIYRVADTGVVALGGVDFDVGEGEFLAVVENVRLPSTASGVKIPAARRTPRELLEVVGLPHRANHRPGQLSGGEQQRVAVAVALSNLPMILLADEPTAELDSESAALVLDAFQSVNHEFGVTVVMVTHDLLAAKRAHRQLRLRDGQLLVEGKAMEPLGTDGRARLPDEAIDALSGLDLEVEVRDGEVRIRRKGEGGLIGE